MTLQKHFATAVVCATLCLGTAWAAPEQHNPQQQRSDRDEMSRGKVDNKEQSGAMRSGQPAMHSGQPAMGPEQHWKDDRGAVRKDHDRYWKPQYRDYVAQDRIFKVLRGQGYARFNGAPYWYQGRYVVKSFDRRGRPVFIEINPYTGGFVGVVRF